MWKNIRIGDWVTLTGVPGKQFGAFKNSTAGLVSDIDQSASPVATILFPVPLGLLYNMAKKKYKEMKVPLKNTKLYEEETRTMERKLMEVICPQVEPEEDNEFPEPAEDWIILNEPACQIEESSENVHENVAVEPAHDDKPVKTEHSEPHRKRTKREKKEELIEIKKELEVVEEVKEEKVAEREVESKKRKRKAPGEAKKKVRSEKVKECKEAEPEVEKDVDAIQAFEVEKDADQVLEVEKAEVLEVEKCEEANQASVDEICEEPTVPTVEKDEANQALCEQVNQASVDKICEEPRVPTVEQGAEANQALEVEKCEEANQASGCEICEEPTVPTVEKDEANQGLEVGRCEEPKEAEKSASEPKDLHPNKCLTMEPKTRSSKTRRRQGTIVHYGALPSEQADVHAKAAKATRNISMDDANAGKEETSPPGLISDGIATASIPSSASTAGNAKSKKMPGAPGVWNFFRVRKAAKARAEVKYENCLIAPGVLNGSLFQTLKVKKEDVNKRLREMWMDEDTQKFYTDLFAASIRMKETFLAAVEAGHPECWGGMNSCVKTWIMTAANVTEEQVQELNNTEWVHTNNSLVFFRQFKEKRT